MDDIEKTLQGTNLFPLPTDLGSTRVSRSHQRPGAGGYGDRQGRRRRRRPYLVDDWRSAAYPLHRPELLDALTRCRSKSAVAFDAGRNNRQQSS